MDKGKHESREPLFPSALLFALIRRLPQLPRACTLAGGDGAGCRQLLCYVFWLGAPTFTTVIWHHPGFHSSERHNFLPFSSFACWDSIHSHQSFTYIYIQMVIGFFSQRRILWAGHLHSCFTAERLPLLLGIRLLRKQQHLNNLKCTKQPIKSRQREVWLQGYSFCPN